MTQTWHDLLFAHWPIETALLRSAVPSALTLDRHDGQAWLGIVAFRMTNVAPRLVPAVPGISAFAELNVRTYVRVGNTPGVYFLSLDAASRVAVRAARLLFNLPYFAADMHVDRPTAVGAERREAAEATSPAVSYESRRRGRTSTAAFTAIYGPTGPAFDPRPGSLESFLTARYCLYALRRSGAPYRLDIHHAPWALQPAAATIARNTMAEASGIPLPAAPPLLHFARRQDMVAWAPERT
jgi:hypothetical protein